MYCVFHRNIGSDIGLLHTEQRFVSGDAHIFIKILNTSTVDITYMVYQYTAPKRQCQYNYIDKNSAPLINYMASKTSIF